MSTRADREYAKWVASRPPQIQQAIRDFPIGSTYTHDDETLFLLGYAERGETNVTLIFSRVDPFEDYETANADENRVYICAEHLKPKGTS